MSLIYFTVWVDVLISTVGVKYNWTKFSRILQKNLIILILAQVFGKKSILRPIIKLWKGIIFKQKKEVTGRNLFQLVLFSSLGTFRQLTVVQESKVVSEGFPTVVFF